MGGMVPFHFGFLGQRGHVCIDIAGETGLGLDEIEIAYDVERFDYLRYIRTQFVGEYN